MATKHQIMLVKTIHRRLKELLGDNKVTVTVSYTSASDMLRITFKKVLKGAAFELPICSSLKEYTLHPEILQYIVTDALDKMPKPPKWTMETVLAELSRRRRDYEQYCYTMPRQQHSAAMLGIGLTSLRDATEGYYTICGGPTARLLDCSTSDLDLFESSFERDAGILSGGEYTRWREAGEPKSWTAPDNGVLPVTGIVRFAGGRTEPLINWEIQYGPREIAAANNWYPTSCTSAPIPATLFGLPVIWADELPPTQGSTNEQA